MTQGRKIECGKLQRKIAIKEVIRQVAISLEAQLYEETDETQITLRFFRR
jgi:hypothetical protein